MSNTTTTANGNAWLRSLRKADLLELAETVNVKVGQSLKKLEIEEKLDSYLADHASEWQTKSATSAYYSSRARAIGSPVKTDAPIDALKVIKKRASKTADQIASAIEGEDTTASALVARTPGRTLSLAQRIPLPSTPRDVTRAIDQRTLALRKRVTSAYEKSGVIEATETARETLSTVTSINIAIAAFELFFLRREVLADRYAFTFPAINALGTSDYPVDIPDLFLLLTSTFWNPFVLYLFTSILAPAFFGYFFNLSSAHSYTNAGRLRANHHDYSVDPLAFSIAKAVLAYVVYQQGVTFGDWIDPVSVARINTSVYGGWKGMIVGSGISALTSVYDAILQK